MASASLTFSASTLTCNTRTTTRPSLRSSVRFPYPTFSCFLASSSISISHSHDTFSSSLLWSTNKTRVFSVLALLQDESTAAATAGELVNSDENMEDDSPRELKIRAIPSEILVCNLPRSCDISDLLEMFKPYGTVQSVEVLRNAETGISRGCGCVTMSSINEAKAAIAALDGSDVGGREMWVTFSANLNSKTKNFEVLNSAPTRDSIFESPHKVYVGNLSWSVKPEDLREHFSQFGTVVSTRVLHDRKAGRNRIYGFLSFSSAAECEAALSASGMEFHGRTLLVREVLKRSQP
ncbi:hypothetical protein HHK36_001385 [Tetracentron sinense]|uniref:RRM domain-containing protein n=1 Tax=Tetracentron sinense TaxID=13715 RepID=A0A835DRZ9_TETSI|nr:hypothetical protein HHK36_001385 [Tetracentron sinense]